MTHRHVLSVSLAVLLSDRGTTGQACTHRGSAACPFCLLPNARQDGFCSKEVRPASLQIVQQGLPSQKDAFVLVGIHVGILRGPVHLDLETWPYLVCLPFPQSTRLANLLLPLISGVTSGHTVTSLLRSYVQPSRMLSIVNST